MKILRLILWICTLFFMQLQYAQQDAQYTQYMYNTVAVNPAYAGINENFSAVALHRNQWSGIEGAPVTQTLSFNMPIYKSKMGLGVSVINDKIGVTKETNFNVDVSYILQTAEDNYLSFGVKAGAHLLDADFSKLDIADATDTEFTSIDAKLSPNIGAGVYFYNQRFYAGLSVPNLLETPHVKQVVKTRGNVARERMNYYFITGYVFDISDDIKFKPSLLTKVTSGAPLQLDLSGNFFFNDKFIIGAAYRLDAAASIMAGFKFAEMFTFGYGYDVDTTKLSQYGGGSHEFFLKFELQKRNSKCRCPKYF